MTGVDVGFGSLRRKEDERFIRGQGRYLDDVLLPGMLHGAMLRSPVAHAHVLSIDTSAALAHPKVHAVITGADLAARGCAWMPTMSGDVQAVLATDKVRFQGQEVAFVIADDHYSAHDALELVDVEYAPLAPVVDPRRALDPEAPVIRDDRDDQYDNHVFDWEAGDRAAADRAFATADVVVEQDMVFPGRIRHRWRPAGRWPSSIGWRGSSPSGRPPRRRTPTAPCTPRSWASPSTGSA